MFRKRSLEKLQEPDNLDQLLVVVRPRAVFTFATLAVVFLIVAIWSVVARIPITVSGYGILLKPRSIKIIQASGGGTVTDVTAFVGQNIRAGETIVKVEQPELVRQLQQQASEYQAMAEFHKKAMAMAEQRRDLELALVEQNLKDTEESIRALLDLQSKFQSNLEAQRAQLGRVATLVEEGITSDSQRLSMQAMVTDGEQRLLRIEQELATLANQKKQQEMQRRKAIQEYEFDIHTRSQSLASLAASIRVSKERLFRQSAVRSRYQGRVLEIAASVGQVIGAASRVAIVQVEAQEPFFRVELADDTSQGTFSLLYKGCETQSLAYNASGAEVASALRELACVKEEGATVHVANPEGMRVFDIGFRDDNPAPHAERLRDQLKISDTSLATADGTPTVGIVTEMGDLVPDEDLKHLGFLTIGDGKRVSPGMEIRMDPTNIERQRFGSLVGKVTDVSAFPVTSEGLINMIGNKEVVDSLLQQGGTIVVEGVLQRSKVDPDAYQWTSKGPDAAITAGTTTTCRITVEERRPITFAIPLLRQWFLGETSLPGPGAPRTASL